MVEILNSPIIREEREREGEGDATGRQPRTHTEQVEQKCGFTMNDDMNGEWWMRIQIQLPQKTHTIIFHV